MAATLDHVSGGRLILGIGAGWHDPEYDAFGYPTDHKVGRFEESLAVITGLIRDGPGRPRRRFVTARDAVLLPPARPDMPILVAAKGPRMLELTARHADAWNLAWFGLPDERLAGVRGGAGRGLRARRPRPGDADDTVGVTVRYPTEPGAEHVARAASTGTAEEIAAGLRAHAEAGADHVIASSTRARGETVAVFAEAVALFRAGLGAPRRAR